MKTETLFYAFEQAFGLLAYTAREMYEAARKRGRKGAEEHMPEMEKRNRQVGVFRKEIIKRLQEEVKGEEDSPQEKAK